MKSETSEDPISLVLTIERHLKVGPRRRSQVVLVTVKKGGGIGLSPDTPVVAKIFDLDLLYFEEWQWGGTRIEYIDYLKGNEVKAYKRPSSLYGTGVPRFYGEYTFAISFLILLEFLPERNLVGYTVSSPSEAEALKLAGRWLVRNYTAKGTYHHDLRAWNLFWNPSSGSLKVIDFELAKFEEQGSVRLVQLWEGGEEDTMESILVECGVPDERPPVPEWMRPNEPSHRIHIEEL